MSTTSDISGVAVGATHSQNAARIALIPLCGLVAVCVALVLPGGVDSGAGDALVGLAGLLVFGPLLALVTWSLLMRPEVRVDQRMLRVRRGILPVISIPLEDVRDLEVASDRFARYVVVHFATTSGAGRGPCRFDVRGFGNDAFDQELAMLREAVGGTPGSPRR